MVRRKNALFCTELRSADKRLAARSLGHALSATLRCGVMREARVPECGHNLVRVPGCTFSGCRSRDLMFRDAGLEF